MERHCVFKFDGDVKRLSAFLFDREPLVRKVPLYSLGDDVADGPVFSPTHSPLSPVPQYRKHRPTEMSFDKK